MVRGTWGAAPVEGLEPDLGDFVVEKMRMSAWEGTRLETILKALHRDTIINTGAWTNMSIEHTARTGADKGYVVDHARGLLRDDERRMAQGLDRIRDAERRRGDQSGRCDRGAEGQVRRKAEARRSSLEQSHDFLQLQDRLVGADEGASLRRVADHIEPRRSR